MPKRYLHGPMTWKVTKSHVERYCELANEPTQQLYKVADHQFREGSKWISWRIVHSLLTKCSEMSVFGSVCEQTCSCGNEMDKKLVTNVWRVLISYIHHTCEYKQYCYVGNTAQHCRLGLFQNSDFEGDLEVSKSTSGGTLCLFGSHTFVPISWMCKKQTSVSHSSTEAEVISLDTGFRMDGISVLDLWDLVIEVCHPHQTEPTKPKM